MITRRSSAAQCDVSFVTPVASSSNFVLSLVYTFSLFMFSAIASHKVISGLSLDSLTTVARLIPHLKRDILQPQMLTQSRNLHVAPPMLSSSFISFLSDLLGIAGAFIPDLWTIIRQEVWDLPVILIRFRAIYWGVSLTKSYVSLQYDPPLVKCDWRSTDIVI